MNSDFSLMDSSSAAIVSSSSAPPPRSAHDNSMKSYDVFISFRGQDTRNNFTSHLHDALCRKKITTFVDDKLKRGDPISTLFPIIENSTFAVIVFSKDYASSRWCLDELVKIVECKEIYRQIVIPVFYNIEPSDVRNQTGSYAKSFSKHAWKLIPKTTMQKWRNALREISLLSGWNSAVTRPDSILTEEIAKDIWKRLKQVYPSANDLVGINSKVKVIESWLRSGSREVCVVGIWGIGGIGKTTLARYIFDKIFGEFEGACFIEDIGRLSKNNSLFLGPRQELCAAILGEENIKTGICNIGLPSRDARFYRKKLLVVFDDVTHTLQIEKLFGRLDIWPNTESRFIITTRDKKVLHWCNQKEIYKLEGLLKDESLQLFSQYAFKQEVPMVEYIGLSIMIVNYAKGIPLVLKVLGVFLYGKEMQVWENAIEKLERTPNKEIQNVLQISYDGLDEDQKEIFLDIACFDFMGWKWESVVDYFDACGFKATVDLDILIDNCLIDKVPFQWMSLKHDGQPKKGIRMHDLLRGMGREIVRKESIDDPGKRSRLWHHKDIYRVLRRNTGTEAIKGISLNISMINDVNLQKNAFKKMKNLRFLKFYYPVSTERVNKLHTPCGVNFVLNELRYFRWDGCPLKSLQPNFNPENLVEIHISDSDIEQLWEDGQALSKLRKLRLYRCNKLTSIPSLSSANCLDTLQITECSSLTSLSPPAHLRSLEIQGCSNLVVIPELPSNVEWFCLKKTAVEELSCISRLSRLKTLHIRNNSKLRCSLDDIHELKSLVDLVIQDCKNFYRLPHDLGSLEGLVSLNVSETAIEELPSSIGCLSRLTDLQLTNAKLKCLPSSICKLKSLQSLELNGSKELQRLPDDLGSLEGLEILNVSETAIEELPSSIGCLSRLTNLQLTNAKLKCLPSSICKLKSLHMLDLNGNKELQRLPHDLGSLEGLVVLNVSETAIEELPSSIGCLSRLTDLQLTNAKLKCLPSSICKLKFLQRLELNGNKELQRLPHDLGGLEDLEELNLSKTSITELPYSVGYLSKLSYIDLGGCSKLKYMPSSISQYLSLDRFIQMRQLSLIGCYNLDWQLPREVMEDVLLKVFENPKSLILTGWERCWPQPLFVIYPGLKIPEWFSCRNVGYSVTLTLPKESSNGKTILFAFSVVVDLPCEDIEFCYKLEYKDGQAQDGVISLSSNTLISYFAKRVEMSKFEGCHVRFGYIRVDSPIPISDLQSAVLTCEFYAYKKNESGKRMNCYTVKECGIHHVSPNQNKHIRSYGSNNDKK